MTSTTISYNHFSGNGNFFPIWNSLKFVTIRVSFSPLAK